MSTQTPSTQTADDIRREIEQTRRELASDVDTLQEKVSPSAVASRKVESARSALITAKEKVMGGASTATSTASSGVGSSLGSVGDAVSATPQQVTAKTRGNPLAAGVIAFGAGWLVSSLLPASKKEQRAVTQLKDAASEHSDTLIAPVKEAAQAVKDEMAPVAKEAADSLKVTATDATENVKGEASSATQDVTGQAQQAREQVSGSASTPSSTY